MPSIGSPIRDTLINTAILLETNKQDLVISGTEVLSSTPADGTVQAIVVDDPLLVDVQQRTIIRSGANSVPARAADTQGSE